MKEYLVQWSGVDESGQKWPDSWLP
eukprot:COSAG04_NODE_4155_length_2266_cov_1.691278_3_plen_24_part_01